MIPVRGTSTRNGWPWVTLGLIVVNFLIFLYTLKIGPEPLWPCSGKGGGAGQIEQGKISLPPCSFWLMATGVWCHCFYTPAGPTSCNMWFCGSSARGWKTTWALALPGFLFICGFFACLFHVLASSTILPRP